MSTTTTNPATTATDAAAAIRHAKFMAIHAGDVAALSAAFDLERETTGGGYQSFDTGMLNLAVQLGHLGCVQYLAEQPFFTSTENAAVTAARYGRLDCLVFLRQRNSPWNVDRVSAAAIVGGFVACIEYAEAQQRIFQDVCAKYGGGGVDDICSLRLLRQAKMAAILNRDLDGLCALTNMYVYPELYGNAPVRQEMMVAAARLGDAECLRFLMRNCGPIVPEVVDAAAGHADCLEVLSSSVLPEFRALVAQEGYARELKAQKEEEHDEAAAAATAAKAAKKKGNGACAML